MNQKNMRKKLLQICFCICFFLCSLFLFTQSIQAEDLNFNNSKTVTIKDQESYPSTRQYIWIKYKAPADGYISLKANYASATAKYSFGGWSLYDSSKYIPLSDKNISYNTKQSDSSYWHSSTFGVKKNSIYYLRVKAYNGVKITCSFKKINEKAGAKRLSAVSLKKNKSKTGLVLAGNDIPDWYKVKLSQKSSLNLYFKVRSEGKFRISLYSEAGKGLCYKIFEYTPKEQKISIRLRNLKTGKITSKVDAGTYYIKIERADGTSNGYYTLKWK